MEDKRVEAIARWLVREIDPAYHYGEQKAFIEDIHYGSFIEKAARLCAASDASAWRQIETAPDNQEICILWKTKTVSVGTKNKDEWCFLNGDKMFGTHAALGWQSLPAPPSDATS